MLPWEHTLDLFSLTYFSQWEKITGSRLNPIRSLNRFAGNTLGLVFTLRCSSKRSFYSKGYSIQFYLLQVVDGHSFIFQPWGPRSSELSTLLSIHWNRQILSEPISCSCYQNSLSVCLPIYNKYIRNTTKPFATVYLESCSFQPPVRLL